MSKINLENYRRNIDAEMWAMLTALGFVLIVFAGLVCASIWFLKELFLG